MHIVKTPIGVTKVMPYGGDPFTALPADFVLALNLNVSSEEGELRAYELCDLLTRHTGRPVFPRVSGGKTNGFYHLQVFVIGLTPEVKQAWVEVVDAMRMEPGCQGFRVHLDEPIRVPLSPTYWRKRTRTKYGTVHVVNDFRVASFDFDYAGFAEAARYYAEDLSRCEGAGMPPPDLPRRARPGQTRKRTQNDPDEEGTSYAVLRGLSDEVSIEDGASPPPSRGNRASDLDAELQRDWRLSTYRGMRAWCVNTSERRRRTRAKDGGPARVPTPRRSPGGS